MKRFHRSLVFTSIVFVLMLTIPCMSFCMQAGKKNHEQGKKSKLKTSLSNLRVSDLYEIEEEVKKNREEKRRSRQQKWKKLFPCFPF